MNLVEAIEAAENGAFVSNERFSSDESLHYCNGKLYYEDGAVVTEEFLEQQDFAKGDTWFIKFTADRVNLEMLRGLHEKAGTYMLSAYPDIESYEDCIIRG